MPGLGSAAVVLTPPTHADPFLPVFHDIGLKQLRMGQQCATVKP